MHSHIHTYEEDQKLRELIQKYGEHSWNLVSSLMENRNQRQCRERWKHYLSCGINEAPKPWSKEEDEIIINKFNELGGKWTKIARELPGRSDLQVKLRYMKHLKNKKDHKNHYKNKSESSDEYYPDDDDDIKIDSIDKMNIHDLSGNDGLYNNNQQVGEQNFKINDQGPSNAESILSEANYDIGNNNDLDFGCDFNLISTNFLTELCQNDENYSNQDFEDNFLNWSFE